ncbi:MAG TPA: plastocyanin/azurin family copper-binding protein [Candidatus Limnocylindrales bacterium]|nr:plastocyanin/azurin family copper-binding protein [Candidatus Limnocylindrales bacterium]
MALTDALTIEPAEMIVKAGQPVIFVVANSGAAVHEFYVGDEAAQAEHEREMAEMGGMPHDEPNGVAVQPGETKELAITFDEPGQLIAGCHLPGHYPGGMRATITVTE